MEEKQSLESHEMSREYALILVLPLLMDYSSS